MQLRHALFALALSPLACGGSGEPSALEKSLPPPTQKLTDLKQTQPEMTPEELAAARKAAGFKSRDEMAAENAAMFEKDARLYIKNHAEDYKQLLADMNKALDSLEKEAKKWAKKPKAFDKFSAKYKETMTELTKRYMEVTGQGAEGGSTQADFSKAFRAWEDLNNDLSPELGSSERFAAALAEIREGLAQVKKTVEEIAADESLVAAEEGGEKPAEP